MTEKAVIRLEAVTLTYPGPPPVTAMRDCNVSVRRGEYVSVVGPSGSGKSTFLNVVGLLDRPSSGRYLLEGVDTGALPEARRTALRGRLLGFVFQAFHLLPALTALENVGLAMLYTGVARDRRVARAQEALAQVGLSHRIQALASDLSGGERQRVAIARAVVNGPSLLLCDEPTGNLDSVSAESILELLEDLHRDGSTIMVVTHSSEVAARAQRTLLIRDGALAEGVGDTGLAPWAGEPG